MGIQQIIESPAFLLALEKARAKALEEEVFEKYDEDEEYSCYSIYIAEVQKKGFIEGFTKGYIKGFLKARTTIAKNCLKEGLAVSLISEITGFSEEEVAKLEV
jgi:predicted transposase/invertase (TIGR01784 family)